MREYLDTKEELFLDKLLSYLKTYYGKDARYRVGQEEAIRDVLQGKRTLVLQKTGWGKSLVYFMATRLIRESTGGLAFIISPLLALMNNQIESAAKLDLQVRTINSENSDEWNYIFEEIIFIMLLFLQGAAYCFILTLLSDLFIIVNAGFP